MLPLAHGSARAALLCVLAVATLSGAREPHWLRMRSANFEIYSSAGERATRDTLGHFEQVRSFFLQTLAKRMTSDRVFIVAFGSKKEYEPYRFNEFATAFYHATADRDYIVLSEAGADVFPVAVHEYVHLVVRHLNLTLPPWLNEGLAELYSTLKPQGENILVGSLIEGRRQALLREKWVPLETILSTTQDSPYYNEKDKAGSFYNESWALTHMLMMSDAYRSRMDQLMLALNDGVPSMEALSRTYGRPIPAIEKDLLTYLRGSVFHGALLPAKLQKGDAAGAAEEAGATDVRLVLAQLMNRRGKEADARKEFEAISAEEPKRPEPYAELGYLAWRTNKNDEARQFFHKAFELGDRNPRMLWDYGRLSAGDSKESVRVLAALMEQQPERVEVRLALARSQLMGQDAAGALKTVAPIRQVGRSEAAQLFRTIAYAQSMLGNQAGAHDAAERWLKESREDIDKAQAEKFLAQLDRRQPAGPAVERAGEPPDDGNPGHPTLRRRESAPAPPEAPPPPRRPFFEGAFVELQCQGEQARMVVATESVRKTFLIEDPTQVRMIRNGAGPADFVCGPQKPAPGVRVE